MSAVAIVQQVLEGLAMSSADPAVVARAEVIATSTLTASVSEEILVDFPEIGAKALAAEVIRRHETTGCMFAPNSMQRVTDWIGDKTEIALATLIDWLDSLEIYCPHEGIDRRAEFGITADAH